MIRIKFDKNRVHIYYNDGKDNGFEAKEPYDRVEVEFWHARGFWQHLKYPLGILRLGWLAKQMGNTFVSMVRSEGTEGKDKAADGV